VSKIVEIKCDACGGDLTDAGAMPTYRLALSPEAVANSGNIRYSVAVCPPIDHTHHFCNLCCLDLWRDRARHRDKLWREWNEKWKTEHGTPDAEGQITFYPTPPDDIRKARDAEFEAATLAAFPTPK
jgi:hypothetical protein